MPGTANGTWPYIQRILALFATGEGLTLDQIRTVCNDDRVTDDTLRIYISQARKLLPPGHMIVLHNRGRRQPLYQQVRHVSRGE